MVIVGGRGLGHSLGHSLNYYKKRKSPRVNQGRVYSFSLGRTPGSLIFVFFFLQKIRAPLAWSTQFVSVFFVLEIAQTVAWHITNEKIHVLLI
jgi:hypothetical protein